MFDSTKYLTTPKAAAYLKVHMQSLYNWRTQGKGPKCTKFGAAYYYDVADLEEWLTASRA